MRVMGILIPMARVGRQMGWCKPGLDRKQRPTMLDIAWAAGLYEGEGSATARTGTVAITQNDRWVLERMALLFGGSITACRTPARKLTYQWKINGGRGRGFLMTIFTFLSPRRKEGVRLLLQASRARVNNLAA
jgi:hypothetical protein